MKDQPIPNKSLLKEDILPLLKIFTVGGTAREEKFRAIPSLQEAHAQPIGFAVHEIAHFLKQQGYLTDITVTCKKGSCELDTMITLLKKNHYAPLLNQVKQELEQDRESRDRYLLTSPRPSFCQPGFFVSSQGEAALAPPLSKKHSR